MDARKVKDGLNRLLRHLPVRLPSTCWTFAGTAPEDAVIPANKPWTCMFSFMNVIADGRPVCFSAQNTGCDGAACYLGFKTPSKTAGRFLAEKEGFKKDADLGQSFYDNIEAHAPESEFVVWETVESAGDQPEIEVVNLWVDALSLAGLVTLANYDRPDNDNVKIPFASGCQSIWTIPYKEKHAEAPVGIVGCMDPAVRRYLPPDVVSFSVTARRFVEMTDNLSGSFLEQHGWLKLFDEKA